MSYMKEIQNYEEMENYFNTVGVEQSVAIMSNNKNAIKNY